MNDEGDYIMNSGTRSTGEDISSPAISTLPGNALFAFFFFFFNLSKPIEYKCTYPGRHWLSEHNQTFPTGLFQPGSPQPVPLPG